MSLYVREAGSSDASAIVFLHGLGLTSAMWLPQFERLPDYYCLAPDLPESGNSTSIGPLSLVDASQRVAEVIHTHVVKGRAHVVGLSMGGAVAVRLLRDEPQVIDHLMVSGASTRLNPILAALNRLNEPVMRLLSPEQQASLMLRQFHIPQEYRFMLLADLRTVKPESITHFSQELTKIELPTVAAVPTLIAVGQQETWFARRAAREMVRTIHGAKGVIVPGVGHAWNLQNPDLFVETLQAWVTDQPLWQRLILI